MIISFIWSVHCKDHTHKISMYNACVQYKNQYGLEYESKTFMSVA